MMLDDSIPKSKQVEQKAEKPVLFVRVDRSPSMKDAGTLKVKTVKVLSFMNNKLSNNSSHI